MDLPVSDVDHVPLHGWISQLTEPFLQRFGQHPGAVLVEPNQAAARDVRIQLNVAVPPLGDDKVGEPDRPAVLRARGMNGAAVGVAEVGVAHVLTVVLEWNDGQGFTVASRWGGEAGDSRRTG